MLYMRLCICYLILLNADNNGIAPLITNCVFHYILLAKKKKFELPVNRNYVGQIHKVKLASVKSVL